MQSELVTRFGEYQFLTDQILQEKDTLLKHYRATLQSAWSIGRLLVAANPRVEYNPYRLDGIPVVPHGDWEEYIGFVLDGRMRTAQRWQKFYTDNPETCPEVGPNSAKMLTAAVGSEESETPPSSAETMRQEIEESADPRAKVLLERIDNGESAKTQYAIFKCLNEVSEPVAETLLRNGIGDYAAISEVQKMYDSIPVQFSTTLGAGLCPIYDDFGSQVMTIPLRAATAEQVHNCYVAELRGVRDVDRAANAPDCILSTICKLDAVGDDEGNVALYVLVTVTDNDRKKLISRTGQHFKITLDELKG